MMGSVVFDIGGTPMIIEHLLSIQDRQTALMKAYDMGHMVCMKMLLDKGSQINMESEVSVVITQ